MAHSVGEAQRHAADDRGPAVGAHDEQAALASEQLQLDLVVDRDVVAEQEDVEAVLERLERFGRGVAAGRRDEREVGAGEFGDGLVDRLRRWGFGRRIAAARAGGKECRGARKRGIGGRRVVGSDRDDEVVRTGVAGRGLRKPRLGEHREVRAGRHDAAGAADSG